MKNKAQTLLKQTRELTIDNEATESIYGALM